MNKIKIMSIMIVAMFIVALFLISSMVPVNAGLDVEQIATPPFYYHNKYAVIIVGNFRDNQHYGWFSKDAQRQYNVLTAKYGFKPDNIYVLFTVSDNASWHLDPSFNPSIVDYNATEKNIKTVFKDLKNTMNSNDLLYVVVIAHGIDLGWYCSSLLHKKFSWWPEVDIFPNGHDTYFEVTKPTDVLTTEKSETDDLGVSNCIAYVPIAEILSQSNVFPAALAHSNQSAQSDQINQIVQSIQGSYADNISKLDNKVFDHELNDYTRDMPARRIIFVLNPCMGGGFINDLSGKNRVIITASKEDELANAPFIGAFYYGLNGDADNNGDGRISLAEVFDYTSNEVKDWLINHPDETPEHPLLDDNGDLFGHNYSESGYDSTTEGKDGYVAAQIYSLSYEKINYPPEKPTITGLKTAKPGQSLAFTFVSTDPEGHNLYYNISWGDNTYENWIGPYKSGEKVTVRHSWSVEGNFTIIAQAKDQYGAKSPQNQINIQIKLKINNDGMTADSATTTTTGSTPTATTIATTSTATTTTISAATRQTNTIG